MAHPPPDPLAAAELLEVAALCAARIAEFDVAATWGRRGQERFREAGQPHRAARLQLDPGFDYVVPWTPADAADDDPVEQLVAEAQRAVTGRDEEQARSLLSRAEAIARTRRDGMALCRVARAGVVGLGAFELGDRLLDEALGCPDVAENVRRQGRVLAMRARARFAAGDIREALEVSRQATASAGAEAEALAWTGRATYGHYLMLSGDVEGGAEMLRQAMAHLPFAETYATLASGYRRFEQGDVDDGLAALRRSVDEVLRVLGTSPIRGTLGVALVGLCALADAHIGNHALALAQVARGDALSYEPFGVNSGDLAYVLARSGAALGDVEAVRSARDRVAALARAADGAGVRAAVDAVHGWAARLEGRADEALARFQAAADTYERAPRAVLAAELWCDAAEVATETATAAAAVRRARAAGEPFGLARVLARAAALDPGRGAAPDGGMLSGLTDREREVVHLAADGLSNREIGGRLFLSEGTVRNYLSTAFAKLGVARRSELGRLLRGPPVTG